MGQRVVKNVAGSGAKWVDVSADRFPGWIASFAVRHGVPAPAGQGEAPENSLMVTPEQQFVIFTAPDGAVAECHPPFPEALAWPRGAAGDGATAGDGDGLEAVGPRAVEIAGAIARHAAEPRAVGVLLARLGGYAAGVFTGYPPALADSKTGSRLVHGQIGRAHV